MSRNYNTYSTLFFAVNNGSLTFFMNVAFILAGFMLASGHGVHMACVTIQKQMSARNHLYELVYFLHEHWSHNMFLIGFYSLVFLLIWAERNGLKRPQRETVLYTFPVNSITQGHDLATDKGHQPTSEGTANNDKSCHGTSSLECRGQLSQSQVQRTSTKLTPSAIETHQSQTISGHNHDNDCKVKKSPLPSTLFTCTCKRSTLMSRANEKRSRVTYATILMNSYSLFAMFIVTWTTRVWPVFVGIYFSAFASMTSTKPLTTLFYFGVLSSQMALYKKLSFAGLSDYLRLCDNNMVISGFFTKAVMVGLPLMLLEFE